MLTYRDDLAVVIYKGNPSSERPYGGVAFGKINGVWKSLGLGLPIEDSPPNHDMSSPTVQALTKRFEGAKDEFWQQFARMRNEVLNGRLRRYPG